MTENPPMENTWRTRAFERGTLPDQVQKFAFRLERAGLEIRSRESGPDCMSWPELVQMFADVGDAVIDEHVRRQREKAEYINAHEGETSSPEEAQGQPHHHPAQSLIVTFNDGSERIIHTHHPIVREGGWIPRMINGVPFLVFGHGVPRQMVPLHNVKSFDISEELL